MNEHLTNSINYAVSDNVSGMQTELVNILGQKIIDALTQKRMEIAQSLLTKESEEELEEKSVSIENVIKDIKSLSDNNFKAKYGISKLEAEKRLKLKEESDEEFEEIDESTMTLVKTPANQLKLARAGKLYHVGTNDSMDARLHSKSKWVKTPVEFLTKVLSATKKGDIAHGFWSQEPITESKK